MSELLKAPDGVLTGFFKFAAMTAGVVLGPLVVVVFDNGATPLSERVNLALVILGCVSLAGGLFGAVRALLLKWAYERLAHGDGWPSSR